MRFFEILRHRLRSLFRRSQAEREMEEELRFHAEQEGLVGMEQIKEECRDARGVGFFENTMRDARYGLRLLGRSPGFTAVAVLTLALGIGVNSAIFSVVDAVILRPLPFPDSERLVSIWERNPKNPASRSTVAPANLGDYRQATPWIAVLSPWTSNGANLSGDGPAERLVTTNVSHRYLDVLGVRPVLGRNFLPEEDQPQRNHVVIISHELWERRYGLDRGILKRKMLLDNVTHDIVGVLPEGFVPPHRVGSPTRNDAFVPFGFDAELLANRGDHEVSVIARLAPGVSLSQAQAGLAAISERLAMAYPDTNKDVRTSMAFLRDDLVRNVAPAMQVLLGAVGLILLVACVNVANLLLVRGASQRREIAVRLALGASRARICGELFVQSFLLAAMGCAFGLLLGSWTRRGLVALAPAGIPRIDAASIDWRVLGFTMAISCLATVLFGLLPAWQTSGVAAGEVLKSGRGMPSARVLRWRSVLLVTEVALSLILTVGAGLLLHSFVRLTGVDIGMQTDRILTMSIPLSQVNYPTQLSRANFFERLEERVARIPGVQAVFATSHLPMRGEWGTGVMVEGAPPPAKGQPGPSVGSQAVTPGFFKALGLSLLAGRFLTPGDREETLRVIVINETMAKQLWPHLPKGQDPLGRRLRRGEKAPWLTVVGVVRNARLRGQEQAYQAEMFIPAAQVGSYPVRMANFAVRAAGDPMKLLGAIQAELRAIDPEQPIVQPATFEELISRRIADRRFMAILLLLFAGVSLALALVGVYGVMAYSVSQRTPEIGVRVALGASPGNILGLFLRRAMVLTIAGVILGVAGAMALSKSLATLLYEIQPTDGATFAAVAVLVCGASLAACYLPSRRAARVDPMVALRYE